MVIYSKYSNKISHLAYEKYIFAVATTFNKHNDTKRSLDNVFFCKFICYKIRRHYQNETTNKLQQKTMCFLQ
jgi:hypothetical protein